MAGAVSPPFPVRPISHEEPELRNAIAKIHHRVADLLRSPPAVGVVVAPSRRTNRLLTSRTLMGSRSDPVSCWAARPRNGAARFGSKGFPRRCAVPSCLVAAG